MTPRRDKAALPDEALRAVVLGSGSAGNAIALTCGGQVVLLDAGFSARETIRRLKAAGIEPARVSAVLLSHEHSDHVRGVRVLASRLGIPVYSSAGTMKATFLERQVTDIRKIEPGETFPIGKVSITSFRTSHDAAEPLGFRFEDSRGTTIGILTDSGIVNDDAIEMLCGCHVLGIESNHDDGMLESGPYPAFLKRRIRSDRGHLSNEAAAHAIAAIACDRLHTIIGLHLSRTNNTSRLAEKAIADALYRLGHPAGIVSASQDSPYSLPEMTVSRKR